VVVLVVVLAEVVWVEGGNVRRSVQGGVSWISKDGLDKANLLAVAAANAVPVPVATLNRNDDDDRR
jgi:hypothetical protein